MAIDDAIAALPAHWHDVTARLGPRARRELDDLVAELNGPGHDRAVSRIADLLVDALPPGHPLLRTLLEGDLYVSARTDWPAITEALRRAAGGVPVGEPSPGAPESSGPRPGEPILRGVAESSLDLPALTAQEVRRRGGDPLDPNLIRLSGPDGDGRWPAFQFHPGGGPRAVVRTVNEILDTAADPVAAADWWRGRNAWLGGPPGDLIGRVPDDHLVRAARAVASEV